MDAILRRDRISPIVKFKHVMYGFIILAAGFVVVMFFLVSNYRPSIEAVGVTSHPVRDQGKTASGKAGKVVIAYAGDIEGSLDPCG